MHSTNSNEAEPETENGLENNEREDRLHQDIEKKIVNLKSNIIKPLDLSASQGESSRKSTPNNRSYRVKTPLNLSKELNMQSPPPVHPIEQMSYTVGTPQQTPTNRRLEIILKLQEKANKEEENYTFKPNITESQKKFTHVANPSHGNSRFDKLYSDAAKRHLDSKWKETIDEKDSANKKLSDNSSRRSRSSSRTDALINRLYSYKPDNEAQEEIRAEMTANLTFKPQISQHAKAIDRSKEKEEHRSERLYQHFLTIQLKKEKLKETTQKIELSECTFSPKLSTSRSSSASLPVRPEASGTNISERQMQFLERKKLKIEEALRLKEVKEKEFLTFKPHVVHKRNGSIEKNENDRQKGMENNQSPTASPSVYERLALPMEKDVSDALIDMKKNLTFQPKLVTKKRNTSPNQKSSEYANAQLRVWAEGEEWKKQVQAELTERKRALTPSFQPKIYAYHHNNHTSDEQNQKENGMDGAKEDMVANQTPDKVETASPGDTTSVQHGKIPAYRRLSALAVRKDILEEELFKKKEEYELQGCTFKPQLVSNIEKFLNERDSSDLHSRLMQEAEVLRAERQRMKEDKEAKEAKQMTLIPQINAKSVSIALRRQSSVASMPINVNQVGEVTADSSVTPQNGALIRANSIFNKLYSTKTESLKQPINPAPIEERVEEDTSSVVRSVALPEKELDNLFDRLNKTPIGITSNLNSGSSESEGDTDARSVTSKFSLRSSRSDTSRLSRKSIVLNEEDLDKVFLRLNTTPIGKISDEVNFLEGSKVVRPEGHLEEVFERLNKTNTESRSAVPNGIASMNEQSRRKSASNLIRNDSFRLLNKNKNETSRRDSKNSESDSSQVLITARDRSPSIGLLEKSQISSTAQIFGEIDNQGKLIPIRRKSISNSGSFSLSTAEPSKDEDDGALQLDTSVEVELNTIYRKAGDITPIVNDSDKAFERVIDREVEKSNHKPLTSILRSSSSSSLSPKKFFPDDEMMENPMLNIKTNGLVINPITDGYVPPPLSPPRVAFRDFSPSDDALSTITSPSVTSPIGSPLKSRKNPETFSAIQKNLSSTAAILVQSEKSNGQKDIKREMSDSNMNPPPLISNSSMKSPTMLTRGHQMKGKNPKLAVAQTADIGSSSSSPKAANQSSKLKANTGTFVGMPHNSVKTDEMNYPKGHLNPTNKVISVKMVESEGTQSSAKPMETVSNKPSRATSAMRSRVGANPSSATTTNPEGDSQSNRLNSQKSLTMNNLHRKNRQESADLKASQQVSSVPSLRGKKKTSNESMISDGSMKNLDPILPSKGSKSLQTFVSMTNIPIIDTPQQSNAKMDHSKQEDVKVMMLHGSGVGINNSTNDPNMKLLSRLSIALDENENQNTLSSKSQSHLFCSNSSEN